MMLSNIETCPIKKFVLFLKIVTVTSFVLLRPFGNLKLVLKKFFFPISSNINVIKGKSNSIKHINYQKSVKTKLENKN